jgi:hypothetical protein
MFPENQPESSFECVTDVDMHVSLLVNKSG